MLSQAEGYRSTDLQRVVSLAQESLSLFREIRSYVLLGTALCWLGNLALKEGDNTAARTYLEEYLALVRKSELGAASFSGLFIAGVPAFRQRKPPLAASRIAAVTTRHQVAPYH